MLEEKKKTVTGVSGDVGIEIDKSISRRIPSGKLGSRWYRSVFDS